MATSSRSKDEPLSPYAAKRDFTKTKEPKPRVPKKPKNKTLSYVIQKHAARRLHYDLRLELDGVLKSWAVTRGPSLSPSEKRLAVEVEDHPLDYGDFEGAIPKGEYGGGEVIVWDRGTWEGDGDPHRALTKGHLEFTIHGEKLHGRWHLVRMRQRRNEKKPQWLLIKADDEAAREGDAAEITELSPLSVKTGRPVESLVDSDPPPDEKNRKAPTAQKKRVQPTKKRKTGNDQFPEFIDPCLATLVDKTPDDPSFVHEIKFDGYRIQIHCHDRKVRYLSRSGLDYTEKIAPSPLHDLIVSAAWPNVIVDGELIVEGPSGLSDFAALQSALKKGERERLIFMAFDCLFQDGDDLRTRPLRERKARLQSLIPENQTLLRYSEEIESGGAELLHHACRLGLEGIVSKKRDAPYRSGRGRDWVKSKCVMRDEFVIAGFTPSTAMKRGIGALVLGAYENDRLIPIGRAGSGFTIDSATELYSQLLKHKQPAPPFAVKPEASLARGAIWTEPLFVADIEYRGVTPDGALRHPVFKGLRDDKEPKSVTRKLEKQKAIPKAEKTAIELTHPERIFWPDAGITKQGLYDYYESIFPWIAPYIVGRPLSLIRCPDGVGEHCFFQKHEWAGLSEAVQRVRDPAGDDEWLVVRDFAALASFAQAGVLEIHPWGATMKDIEHPDRIVFDLDPGENVSWSQMIKAAQEVRERLAQMKLQSFVKTSGGKGLHVVVPLKPERVWDNVKDWTHRFAAAIAADTPQSYVATIKKSARAGKILIDYLRNSRGATAVAAFSPRARAGAPVSTPLAWDELEAITPTQFHVGNIFSRLEHMKHDPWQEFAKIKQSLPNDGNTTKAAKSGTRRKPVR